MLGYIIAIIGSILLIVIAAALFASGKSRKRTAETPASNEDYESGTTYAKPQQEGTTTAQVEKARRPAPAMASKTNKETKS